MITYKCLPNCPKGTYYNTSTQSCNKCIKNCDTCKNDQTCSECTIGFYANYENPMEELFP